MISQFLPRNFPGSDPDPIDVLKRSEPGGLPSLNEGVRVVAVLNAVGSNFTNSIIFENEGSGNAGPRIRTSSTWASLASFQDQFDPNVEFHITMAAHRADTN